MKRIAALILMLSVLLPVRAKCKSSFDVRVGGKKVTVYDLRVSPADSLLRMKGMDDKKGSKDIFEKAAFCSADIDAPALVKVKVASEVRSAKVLPSSRGITPQVSGKEISFEAAPGDRLTLEVNGDEIHSLHIFTNAREEDVPSPTDPNVLYYGPGEHYVSRIIVRSGQTLYLAPGAVLYGEMFQREKGGAYSPVVSLIGDNIRVCGRGIIDGSLCETLTTNLLYINGKNITVEGIILRDASVWTVPVKNSENVVLEGVKILGYRANSDGIDICNSRGVTVKNCFVRTLDDLVVVKTTRAGGTAENIRVTGNVLWNEVAHALSVGAEINHDISDVVFEDNDIIHDKGREWSLRVYHCDNAKVSGVVFRNIRIEESKNLISLWINKAVWSSSEERGRIDGVLFENIRAERVSNPAVQVLGYDGEHLVENVTFDGVTVDGKGISPNNLKTNGFTKNIIIKQ